MGLYARYTRIKIINPYRDTAAAAAVASVLTTYTGETGGSACDGYKPLSYCDSGDKHQSRCRNGIPYAIVFLYFCVFV